MAKKIYPLLILIIIAAIVSLAGLFYWQTGKSPLSYIKRSQHTRQAESERTAQKQNNQLPQISENEVTTSSPPFVVKGEISRGNPNKKQVIFTFDAGAGINSAQKILETAQKHSVKITFFVTGKFAEKNPELIKQIAADGHEIFNHTYSHPHLTQLTDDQIKEDLNKADEIISALTGKTTKPYFRPPFGDRNKQVLDVAIGLGWQSVFWTTDALDWMSDKTDAQVKEKIYSNLKNGAIILMHVGDNITGNILDEIFTKIENDGYKIVNLTEGIK